MSPDELVDLLNEYAVFAVGMIVVFAVGFLFLRVRRIGAQLDALRAEVNALSAVEQRNFLIALKVNGTEPPIVPALSDLKKLAEVVGRAAASLKCGR
jgi:hypothetical protein